MRPLSLALSLALLLNASVACAPRPPPASPPVSAPEDSREAVWSRELSFARSVADHDAVAFAEHVLEGAVFAGGGGTDRGRGAIVKAWDPVIRGEGMVFRWHPVEVVVTSDPHVAMSRGPAWIEKTRPDGTKQLLLAAFQSTWVKDRDGAWRVAVDGGVPFKEVTREELDRVLATLPASCPKGP